MTTIYVYLFVRKMVKEYDLDPKQVINFVLRHLILILMQCGTEHNAT